MYLSSDEIPSPLEQVTPGSYVFLTKVDPLAHARERFEDLQFAIEFKKWHIINYLQFQEAVDLEACIFDILKGLFGLRGAATSSEAEKESLSNLYAAALNLENLCNRDSLEPGLHSLTAPCARLRTVGRPIAFSAFEVHLAAPDVRSSLAQNLVTELEAVMAGCFDLEFQRFSPVMSVSSLRDVRHVLAVTSPHEADGHQWTTKVLITGTRLREAQLMLKVIEDHREEAGWDISLPISTWKHGWEIYTHATFEKLLAAKRVDAVLDWLYVNMENAELNINASQSNHDVMYLGGSVNNWCNKAAGKLEQAHAHELDFEPLGLPNAARILQRHGQAIRTLSLIGCRSLFQKKMLLYEMRNALDHISAVREGQIVFTY